SLSAGSRAGSRLLARSSSRPASDCASSGNAAARTTAKLLVSARGATALSRRVLPIPASPATNSSPPSPAAAPASRSSIRARNESRPTRTGDWIVPRALTTYHPPDLSIQPPGIRIQPRGIRALDRCLRRPAPPRLDRSSQRCSGGATMSTVAAQSQRNGVDVAKLFATLDAVKAHPEAAQFRFGVNNRWISGTHNRNEISTFY